MKFVLTLYLCSWLGETTCFMEKVSPVEYQTHYGCVSDGYIRSYSLVMNMGEDKVNQEKLVVTFKCEEDNSKPDV